MGLEATIEPFEVDMATMEEAVFFADGEAIPCKGYFNAGTAEVEAPFYYLRSTDDYSLSLCKGKIVMIDGYLGYWMYQDILENGAVGEGEEIPYSLTNVEEVYYEDLELEKYAKAVSVEAVNKYGAVNAITRTDAAFRNELVGKVMDRFYTFLQTGTLTMIPGTPKSPPPTVTATKTQMDGSPTEPPTTWG